MLAVWLRASPHFVLTMVPLAQLAPTQRGQVDTMTDGRDPPIPGALGGTPSATPTVPDDAQFDAFYRNEFDPLVHFVRRRWRAEDDPEAVAQESLVRLLRCISHQPARAWRLLLYRIAVNLVKERWRRTHVRYDLQRVPLDELETGEWEPATNVPGPDEAAVHAQHRARLTAAVLRLPTQRRKVYLSRFARGMTIVEISQHYGISQRMVEKHLSKSLAQIRQALASTKAGG